MENRAIIVNMEEYEGKIEVDIEDALLKAGELNLDLVRFSSKNGVAICKVIDYNKLKYDADKARKNNKINIQNKEIRMNYNIAENDIKIKVRNVERLLKSGHNVTVSIFFKGRTVKLSNKGVYMLDDILDSLTVDYVINKKPTIDNNRVWMKLSSKNN